MEREDFNPLENYSDDDLLFELQLRKERREHKNAAPVQKEIVDDSSIRECLAGIITSIADGTYHEDNDDAHYLYEGLFNLYYGPEFWDWKRKLTE